jgi:DNA-binding helix-hairpin-helix protein with protein kinase domain
MAVRVRTDRDRELRLGERRDNGGEGVVYEIEGRPGLVAKLLLRNQDTAITHRRLTSLVRQGRSPRTAALLAANMRRAAWPIAVITTVDRKISGYVMPDLEPQFRTLDCLLSAEIRQECFPAATWATSLAAAASLARLVADLHAAGYVIGDMKRENLWSDEHGNVAVSDVDSFQFTDAALFFACTSRTPGYTAPEGIDVAGSRLDESSDDFVLAVLVYQLLMAGMHPFFGQPADGSPYVSFDDNVMRGRARLVRPGSVLVPPGSPPLSVLPVSLQHYFLLCFDDRGRQERARRPSARDWLRRLDAETAAGRLRRCARVASHAYTADRAACPWCELAETGHDPYPRAPDGQPAPSG